MGQGISCASRDDDHGIFTAVQFRDLAAVVALLEHEPNLLHRSTAFERHSSLHIAAAHGRIEILSMILDRSINPDVLNRYRQTPLMLAAMHGKITCVEKLIQAGANILMFDSLNGRTCLHYAAYYGHSDCVQAILSAARSSTVAAYWGYGRYVNIRDGKGATPLHLAARQKRAGCAHILLDNGALVCASTGGYVLPGSTPLHLAARGGSLDCIRLLLAWGADRLQRDASGRIPYAVALKHRHGACAALLNPSSAEPIVWPSPVKFINELKQDAKALLEQALMEVNMQREKRILKGAALLPSPSHSDAEMADSISEASDSEICCICFDQICTIEVQDCGHQMCAQCTLALCCHNKPNPSTAFIATPVCPFCRREIAQLAVAKVKIDRDVECDISSNLSTSRKSWKLGEGSSSFNALSSVGSFSKVNSCDSGRIAAETGWADKELDVA